MKDKNLKRLTQELFLKDLVYQNTVPEQHFLRRLANTIEWPTFGKRLIALYGGEEEARRLPCDAVLLLKMLLLAYVYNLTDRQVETYVNENLSAKYFLGLAVTETAPHHSILSAFKAQIIARGKAAYLRELLDEIVRQALAQGVQFESIYIWSNSPAPTEVKADKKRRK